MILEMQFFQPWVLPQELSYFMACPL